jgi:hypothetical protein
MAVNINGTGSITGLSSISSPGISGVPVGSASAPAFSFTGDTNTGIYSPGADQVAVATNGVGRLVIDSLGRLLIGETAAATSESFLTVKNGSGACELNIMSSSTSASVINLGDTGDYNIGRIKYDQSGNSLQFDTFNAERLRITSAGLVGIGTSAPGELLHINKTTTDAAVALISNTGGNTRIGVENSAGNGILNGAGAYDTTIRAAGGTGISFGSGYAAPAVRIDSSGRVGIGTTSPNANNKVDIAGSLLLSGSDNSINLTNGLL